MKFPFLALLLVLLISCNENIPTTKEAAIINKVIDVAGADKYDNASIEFIFRKNQYTSERKNGRFKFTRTRKDSLGQKVKDILDNDKVQRFVDGKEVRLTDSLAAVIGESVNSVHYFVQLPYGLDGKAVEKELVGEDEINGKKYYEMKVTFEEEGGGTDHEDVYMYWIEKKDYTIDYMAYRFFINDGGIRFRVAKNPRVLEGIRFVDYENYKTDDLSTPLQLLDDLYLQGKLTKVSHIENEIKKVVID
ncbi:MAG: DUF6503 family protein [Salinimicrobium sp.]